MSAASATKLSQLTFSAVARGSLPARALASAFDAVVFDKDGTLLDYEASWNPAIYDAICESAGDDDGLRAKIASTLGYDMVERRALRDAPVVHAPNDELVELLALAPVHLRLRLALAEVALHLEVLVSCSAGSRRRVSDGRSAA